MSTEIQKEINAGVINKFITDNKVDTNLISDGYHTFGELYDHRIALYIMLCNCLKTIVPVWKSKTHHDGSVWDGWFIMGIYESAGYQISYHLPMSYWDLTSFAQTREQAPQFDGHTSADVLERILRMI
jgi:hypothetical protein